MISNIDVCVGEALSPLQCRDIPYHQSTQKVYWTWLPK